MKQKIFCTDTALYRPPELAQISFMQNLELHLAAASLHSYTLFIFRGGVEGKNLQQELVERVG